MLAPFRGEGVACLLLQTAGVMVADSSLVVTGSGQSGDR